MKLEIGAVWIDPPGLEITSLPIAYTNIDAEVRIYLGDRLFFDATVCIVELANAVQRWSAADRPRPARFRFESGDDEEPNILCFERSDEGVRLSSAWQKFHADEKVSEEQLDGALRGFVREVVRRCRDDLGIDVKGWIGRAN
ncbi:MAG: hypothetical protein ACR2PO_15025 [Methyloligellaceae bacterium]